jgi:hypothetical protein
VVDFSHSCRVPCVQALIPKSNGQPTFISNNIRIMDFKKLWTKLFTRNSEADDLALHVSGATVRHRNPFEDLVVPRNEEGLSQEFIEKWIAPFYMSILSHELSNADEATIKAFAEAAREINPDIVKTLLGDFNWRPRITGALFSAVNEYKEAEDIIGKHLLKSEVCYAGVGYCLALATFGSDNAKDYLTSYLEYYLDRTDLWFDQVPAFCALAYLDNDRANRLLGKLDSFVADKEQWNLENSRRHFNNCMRTLDRIRIARDASKE